MKLQDYIHYYIGCRVQHEFITKTKNVELRYGILMGLHTSEIINRCYLQFDSYSDSVRFDSIKLILRKLEDITNEECDAYNMILYTMHSVNKMQDQMKTGAALTDYLIKQQFDLFGLCEAGLAIDSKTLK